MALFAGWFQHIHGGCAPIASIRVEREQVDHDCAIQTSAARYRGLRTGLATVSVCLWLLRVAALGIRVPGRRPRASSESPTDG